MKVSEFKHINLLYGKDIT